MIAITTKRVTLHFNEKTSSPAHRHCTPRLSPNISDEQGWVGSLQRIYDEQGKGGGRVGVGGGRGGVGGSWGIIVAKKTNNKCSNFFTEARVFFS